jgi:DNA-binding response OmpR family regulator
MLAGMWQGLTGAPAEAASPKELTAEIPDALRVLVLEDNVNLAGMLKRFFTSKGHHSAVAHLGGEALRLLEAQQFHLALVDIDLPDTTGFEVVAKALAQGRLQGTKIIFCSGDPSAERMAMAGQFLGSVFLPKPYEIPDLSAVIRQLFSPRQPRTPA